jgi:hypothetical protein
MASNRPARYRGASFADNGLVQTAQDNRNIALQEGGQLQNEGQTLYNETGSNTDYYSDQQKGYQDQADQAYGQLQQTPGYTDQEAAQIDPNFAQYQTGSDALNQQYLTGAEQNAIAGNPAAAMGYYDPSQLTQFEQHGDQIQDDATQNLQGNLTGAQQAGASAADRTLTNEGSSLVSAFGDESAGLKAAVDPSQLGLSQGFSSNYLMTPGQQQDMVTAAGTTAGNQFRASEDQIQRQAAAQGNTSPAAVAAMTEQMDRDSAASAGDAMTEARIDASNAAAQRSQTEEQMRLGTAQDISSREQQNATTLGNTQIQAAETYGQQGQQNDLAQEQAAMNAASEGGEAALSTAARTSASDVALAQQEQQTGQTLAGTADQEASQRATTLATNRQATTGNVQNTQYNQGMQTAEAGSQAGQTVANERIAGQNTYRQYLGGQSNTMLNASQTARGQQIGAYGGQTSAYGTQMGATNQATSTAVNANGQPGTADKIIGGITGAISALEDGGAGKKGKLAIVGEHGPEWVGPLEDGGMAPGSAAGNIPRYGGAPPTVSMLQPGTQPAPQPAAPQPPTYQPPFGAGSPGAPASTMQPAMPAPPPASATSAAPVQAQAPSGWQSRQQPARYGQKSRNSSAWGAPNQGSGSGSSRSSGSSGGSSSSASAPQAPQMYDDGGSVNSNGDDLSAALGDFARYDASQGMGAPTGGIGPNSLATQKNPGFWQRYRAQTQGQQGNGGGTRPWSPVDTYSGIGKAAGTVAAALLADGGTSQPMPGVTPTPGGGAIVTRPTLVALGDKGKTDAVVPFNRTSTTKMPASAMQLVRSRYRRPTGPAGPHGPIRPLVPLHPSPAYR